MCIDLNYNIYYRTPPKKKKCRCSPVYYFKMIHFSIMCMFLVNITRNYYFLGLQIEFSVVHIMLDTYSQYQIFFI